MTRKGIGLMVSAGTIIALAYAVLLYLWADRIDLVALSDIAIQPDLNLDAQSNRAIGTLRSGDKLPVVACTDTKSYITPKVRLPNGQEGFVYGTDYKLVQTSKKIYDFPYNVAFGCGPLLGGT